MLRRRFLTALILAPLVLGAIAYGGWAVPAVVLVVVGIAAYELADALRPLPLLAAFGTGAFPVLLSIPYGLSGILAGAILSLPWALLWLAGRPEVRTLRALLALLLMAIWVGTPLALLSLTGELPGGRYLLLLAVVGPWISDISAYFSGVLFGRHLLLPNLSPKKTVEGAVGGLLLTAAVMSPLAHGFLGLSLVEAALLGLTISALSQAGDLFESILKRLLDLKDLGNLLPGHGGILDRIDSLLFTAPGVYYLYILFVL